MTVYSIDPLRDERWTEFLRRCHSASVFHTPQWLEAVQRTYGYVPVVYTTSAPGSPLSNGVVFCQINSWLTGRRMVSVPFSDHCQPLLDSPASTAVIVGELKKSVESGQWKYIELRPISESFAADGAVRSGVAYLHTLDLAPSEHELLHLTHKTCIQKVIKRAGREELGYESGNSSQLLDAFYGLMVQTRRRHQLPPQPIAWFRNLAASMGDMLQFRVAFKNKKAIASIMTLRYKDAVVYKYGCSEHASQNLGGMPFLLWNTIVEAKAAGLASMDFGRSDADNPGLILFKDRWGTKSSQLTYLRWSRKPLPEQAWQRSSRIVKQLFAIMPDVVLKATGRILYRHVG